MPWRRWDDPHNPENRNAGNGGDVVKHVVYATLLDLLLARAPWRDGLRLRECHAGRAAYRIGRDDPRRALAAALRREDNALSSAQRRALSALGLPHDGSWYAGSAALLATRLADAPGRHAYEGYEWAPETRAIARAALEEAVGGRLSIRWPDGPPPDHRFEGEMHVARAMPGYDERDVVLLDPFGLWRRPKLAERRRRYGAIVDAYLARGSSAPPLGWFFVWANDEAGEEDQRGVSPPVAHGYQALRVRLIDAGRRPLLVRWRWDLTCAMWLLVPDALRDELEAALAARLRRVARLAGAAGVGPAALEVSSL